MPGSEKQDRRVIATEPFDDDTSRPAKISLTRRQGVGIIDRQSKPHHPAKLVEGRLGLECCFRFRGGEFGDHACVRAVEGLDQRRHPPPAALTEIRPERPVPYLGRAPTGTECFTGLTNEFPLQRATANGSPEVAVRAKDNPRS